MLMVYQFYFEFINIWVSQIEINLIFIFGSIFVCFWTNKKFRWTKMDYFLRKSPSKYIINLMDVNKNNLVFFVSDTWQKFLVTKSDYSRLQGNFHFVFNQRKSEVNLTKATSSPESPCSVSPAHISINLWLSVMLDSLSSSFTSISFLTLISESC